MIPGLIVFDCDGVLVDSEVLSIKALTQVLNAAGIDIAYERVAGYFGLKQADILLKISEQTGKDVGEAVAAQIWPATRAIFERELRPMPGIVAFLDRHPDVKRCVASSSSLERIHTSLRLTGLAPYFGDAVFSSTQVARGKPAPDLVLFAAASMGIDPKACCVIEDSRFGVQGAMAAGMSPIGFTGGSHMEPHHAQVLKEAGAIAVAESFEAVERAIFG